jgi:hypothetical protein
MKANTQSMSIVANTLRKQIRQHEIRLNALAHDDGLTFMLEKDEIDAVRTMIKNKISFLENSANELFSDMQTEEINNQI